MPGQSVSDSLWAKKEKAVHGSRRCHGGMGVGMFDIRQMDTALYTLS
jgi:hypothetical protein